MEAPRPDRGEGSLDAAARVKIDAAIDELYLKGRAVEAEAELKGVYVACGDRCSPAVKARAWMYVGILWGNGASDLGRAREAFRFALSLAPDLPLDEALASPVTRQAFELERAQVRSGLGGAPAAAGSAAP